MPQNPNPQYYRRQKMSPNGNRWSLSFDSVADYNKFIADNIRTATDRAKRYLDNYSTGNAVRSAINIGGEFWYGTTDATQVKQNLDTFLYRADLQRVLSNITNRINSINLSDIDQQKTIKFTEQEIGIFSFDLASLGLIKVFEYYSPLINDFVNPNLVQSYKNGNGQTVYYFIGQKYVPSSEIEYNFKSAGFYNVELGKNIPKDEYNKLFHEAA